jgi:hypothetical protein
MHGVSIDLYSFSVSNKLQLTYRNKGKAGYSVSLFTCHITKVYR